jgi:hypothetical protein
MTVSLETVDAHVKEGKKCLFFDSNKVGAEAT